MTTKNFSVFDCDSHVVEPPEIWDQYVPAKVRTWVKTQFHFHTDTDLLCINGRVVPAARERSNAAEVGWPRWDKKMIGQLTPGTDEWQQRSGGWPAAAIRTPACATWMRSAPTRSCSSRAGSCGSRSCGTRKLRRS